jgi:hypothetical protein
MRIKNWKLFNESVDHIIEGELEDIVIHFCEDANVSFELEKIYCDGGIYIWKIDDSREIRSKYNYWDFFESHKRMALEVGYHFHLVGPLNDFIVFSKFGDLKQTLIELLDWISGLELVSNEKPFNNKYVVGKKIVYSYSYEGKKLIEWCKYVNSDGLESLDARKDSFSNGEIASHYRSIVYLETFILSLLLDKFDSNINTLKSWLVEIDPLFKKYNLEVSEHKQWTNL